MFLAVSVLCLGISLNYSKLVGQMYYSLESSQVVDLAAQAKQVLNLLCLSRQRKRIKSSWYYRSKI